MGERSEAPGPPSAVCSSQETRTPLAALPPVSDPVGALSRLLSLHLCNVFQVLK